MNEKELIFKCHGCNQKKVRGVVDGHVGDIELLGDTVCKDCWDLMSPFERLAVVKLSTISYQIRIYMEEK